jgi:hypothetical protein
MISPGSSTGSAIRIDPSSKRASGITLSDSGAA